VNIKKGQFLSPWDIENAVEKVAGTGNEKIILTERGSSFGYRNLVVDMRAFPIMRKLGYPVVFDVTHSVQLPGGEGTSSGGQPEFIETLARAGTAAGADGIFLEVHESPARALSDGTNALPLENFRPLLVRLAQIAALVRGWEAPAASTVRVPEQPAAHSSAGAVAGAVPSAPSGTEKGRPPETERRTWRVRQ
jgi:2-dehydro-3-deoxyphosphooctonate aldolase (KDO 8-P synthase)